MSSTPIAVNYVAGVEGRSVADFLPSGLPLRMDPTLAAGRAGTFLDVGESVVTLANPGPSPVTITACPHTSAIGLTVPAGTTIALFGGRNVFSYTIPTNEAGAGQADAGGAVGTHTFTSFGDLSGTVAAVASQPSGAITFCAGVAVVPIFFPGVGRQ